MAVVRMRHDFFASALPFPNGRYLDTISPKTQKDNWGVILAALDALQHDCIAGQKMGGWVAIGEGIIAAMWPSGSFMDKRYGVDTSEVDGVRSLQESYNYTSTELGG